MSGSLAISEAPEISVVISTYDRPEELARCLEALLIQRLGRRFEIIVVDNHPSSGMTAVLTGHFPAVRWIEAKPSGRLASARNQGILEARGTVIVTTDDDVIPPPEWLGHLTEPLFQGDPSLAATTGNCLPCKVETEAELLFEAYGGLRHGEEAACFDAGWMAQWRVGFPHLWRIGTTANAAFLSSVFRDPRVGLFETQLGPGTPSGSWEDLYSFYRILLAGYRICYLPEAALLHAHRESMEPLTRQLCAYRSGETAFLALVLTRHRDWRALGQALLWIPQWRLRLFLGELCRRVAGSRRYPFRVLWLESMAYFKGPWAWWRTRKDGR